MESLLYPERLASAGGPIPALLPSELAYLSFLATEGDPRMREHLFTADLLASMPNKRRHPSASPPSGNSEHPRFADQSGYFAAAGPLSLPSCAPGPPSSMAAATTAAGFGRSLPTSAIPAAGFASSFNCPDLYYNVVGDVPWEGGSYADGSVAFNSSSTMMEPAPLDFDFASALAYLDALPLYYTPPSSYSGGVGKRKADWQDNDVGQPGPKMARIDGGGFTYPSSDFQYPTSSSSPPGCSYSSSYSSSVDPLDTHFSPTAAVHTVVDIHADMPSPSGILDSPFLASSSFSSSSDEEGSNGNGSSSSPTSSEGEEDVENFARFDSFSPPPPPASLHFHRHQYDAFLEAQEEGEVNDESLSADLRLARVPGAAYSVITGIPEAPSLPSVFVHPPDVDEEGEGVQEELEDTGGMEDIQEAWSSSEAGVGGGWLSV